MATAKPIDGASRMEVRHLIRVLIQRWWLIVPIFLLTVGATLVFSLSQPRIYEASSTYVVRATSLISDDVLSALGILTRQSQIAETYAQAGQSRTIQQQAAESLSLSGGEKDDISVESRLVPGTTLLQLRCRTTDPALAQEYCNALGAALIIYARGLYPSFELAVLDTAALPNQPISPDVPLNVALGIAVGLVLAVGLGILAEILTPSARVHPKFEVMDRESSAYSGAYFLMRLRQEVSRARRSGANPATVALIDVNHSGVLDGLDPRSRVDTLRRLASLLESHIRIEDLSARLEADTFALLLPDTTEDEAIKIVEALRSRIAAPAVGIDSGGDAVRVQPAAGVVEFKGEGLTAEDVLHSARRALLDAGSVPAGTTQASSAAVQPGV
jgi:diguanylate cyclase (GGDEF)-like protein